MNTSAAKAPTMRLHTAICSYCDLAILPSQTAIVDPNDENAVMHDQCGRELESFNVRAPGADSESALRTEHANRPESVSARLDARHGGRR